MNTRIPRSFAWAFGLSLGLSPSLLAQTAPAPEAAPDADEEEIILDVFTINTDKDEGYVAVDSLAGGRTNTPIKFTPSVMSSLTRTFIDDVAITNVRDALKWSPNVVPSDYYVGKQLANAFNNWDYNFRGAGQSLQGGAGPTRNYFTFYTAADSYNIDRIEFDRGPNSILFGVGTVGGVLSTYTKMPKFDKDFGNVTTIVDSNGSLRAEVDVNRRLNEKFALRVNALVDRNRGWRENDKNDMEAIDLSLTFRPTDKTSIRVELEGAQSEITLISSLMNDGISRWDGTSYSDTWGAPVTGGVTRPSQSAGWWTDPYNVWIPGLADKGALDWNGGVISAGIDPDGIPFAPREGWYKTFVPLYSWMAAPPAPEDIPVLPSRDFTYGNGISTPEYYDATVWFDQRVNENLDFSVTGYHYANDQTAKDYEGAGNIYVDLNRQLPDGTANPNVGKPFADFFLSKQTQEREVSEVRAQVNYRMDGEIFNIPVRQVFSLAAGTQEITWSARQYNAQLQGTGETDPGRNLVWGRLYLDKPNQSMRLPDTLNGREVIYTRWPTEWFDFDETYDLTNVAFVSHTRLWNDALSILAGARKDDYEHRKVGAFTGNVVEDGADGTTYSIGAIYYWKSVGVFANYSENFDPIGPGKQNGLDGNPFGPAEGESFEYGFRVSTGDGKYYASISRYESKSSGRIFNGGKPDFQGMWRNYYDSLNQPWDTSRTTLPYDDTEALDVSGFEIDFVANPLDSLRVSFTFGKPDSEIVDALPGARAYYNEYLATWQTATTPAEGGSATAAQNLQNQIASSANTLAQNVAGKTKTGLVDYTASVFANYTFLGETLKGFSVGGGVALTGEQYVGEFGAPDGQPKFAHYADERLSTNMVLAYAMKLGEIPVRLQLNIDNVLDDKDPIVTGYHWGWITSPGHAVPNAYILPAPRTFRLSARFTF
ncbi:MAG: TonB-dependent receptor plug domain-containing protein [Opitutaceae bacterium]|nr:TonB-dependent receptor plug domain-containing protein [Opitutaceae bacterium]